MRAEIPISATHYPLFNVPREHRATAFRERILTTGTDVVHAHLLSGADVAAIAQTVPVLLSLHNMPAAWPSGTVDCLQRECAAVLGVPCGFGVLDAAQEVDPRFAADFRVVPNGIDPRPFESSARQRSAGLAWRRSLGIEADDLVCLSIANPRAQKRLHLLPEILEAVQARLLGRKVHVCWAGEFLPIGTDSKEALARLSTAVEKLGVRASQFHRLGLVTDVAPLLHGADMALCVSEFEGLSLAWLEAFAAGLPLVSTTVCGIAEALAAVQGAPIWTVPVDASPSKFADAVLAASAAVSAERRSFLAPCHHASTLARRVVWLGERIAYQGSRSRQKPDGIVLITNNFSTGGAQRSAYRLVLSLLQAGVRVAIGVVQENPHHPSRWLRELQAQPGLTVFVAPNIEQVGGEGAARFLARCIDSFAPTAVVFWNLVTSCKVWLADGMVRTAVFDVSPGEMYFDSLHKYFEKPQTGIPVRSSREYGRLLTAAVVKFSSEAATAADTLGCLVQVVPNGVPLQPLPKTWRLGRAISGLRLGTAARLSPDKRVELLLEAFEKALPHLPRCTLHIAGAPDASSESQAYAARLRRQAARLPVRWHGLVRNVEGYLRNLDLFAQVSEPGGCPNASLEAMACGLPVVATAHGGVAEQVVSGVTGWLTPRNDAAALASALVEAADLGMRDRLRTMGLAGRHHVATAFSMEMMVHRYRTLFGV
jgi:glycosyltransferase involved in cell wall biosynthesis